MNQTPTRNCDVLLTFPANTEDHVLMWLLARLKSRTPQLEVHVRHHNSTGVHGFYFTSDHDSLLKASTELEIKKTLKDEFGGGQKEFDYEEKHNFKDWSDEHNFFSSQERQNIVRHILYNLRAVSGDELGSIKFLEGQAIVPILVSKKIVRRVLPLHKTEDLTELRKTWVQAFTKPQPLDKICVYFGVKIAMYFAYLGHYTSAVCIPALLGTAIYICTYFIHDQEFHDLTFVLFALFNVTWATLYLEHWKRRSSELAYRWGTLDQEPDLITEPRPLYTGELRTSPVTGRVEFYYPPWKRAMFRYLVSVPIIILCLCVVLGVMMTILTFDEHIIHEIGEGNLPKFCKFGPKILMAISIGILDDIYKRIALWLNAMENYREARSYENHYILKLVCFQFVNSFLSLFYLAFYVQDTKRLREQLAALLITRQVIGNIKEALLPYLMEKAKLLHVGYKLTADMSPGTIQSEMKDLIDSGRTEQEPPTTTTIQIKRPQNTIELIVFIYKIHRAIYRDIYRILLDSNHSASGGGEKKSDDEQEYKGPSLTQAEVEGQMPKYDDTFEDYLEMFIQFGYVILFSSAFPLAALCALLNNVIEIRSDAFKLCTTFQRPFGQQVGDIGIWQDMLEIMIVIAIVVNSALIGTSGQISRWFTHMSEAQIFLTIVILEHIILAFRCALAYAIPDVPHWIDEEMARREFRRRAAFKRQQSFNDEPRTPTPAREV